MNKLKSILNVNMINLLNYIDMRYFKFFDVKELFTNNSESEMLDILKSNFLDDLLILLQFVDNLREFADTPVRITSAYRDKLHNLRVGGVETSQHLLGQALDIQPVSMPFSSFVYFFREFCEVSALKKFIGQVVIYPTFIHIGLRTQSHKTFFIYDQRTSKKSD